MNNFERCPTGARPERCSDCRFPREAEQPVRPVTESNPPPELPVKKPASNIVQLGIKIPEIPEREW